MSPAAFLQRLEEACGRHDQAAVRHDRLDEDRRHLLRRAGRLELVVEHVEHGLGRIPRPVGVGVGQQHQAGPGQRVGHRRVARDAHRARHATVVGADEGNEAGAASRRLQHAGGGIVGVGARMAVPDASLGVSRHRLQQRLGEGRRRLVRIHEQARARHVGHRLGHSLDHGGMAIAEACRCRRGGEVEDGAAVVGREVRSAPTARSQRVEAQLLDASDRGVVTLAERRVRSRHACCLRRAGAAMRLMAIAGGGQPITSYEV